MSKMSVTAEPGKQEIVMSRTFDAPRELVFKAMTDPELIPQWWGPRAYTTLVDKMDAKHGGVWRFVHRGADGVEHGFRGVYHLIAPNEKIIQTFEFEGFPGHVSLETMTFEDQDGKTKVIATSVYQSVEDRDGTLMSGMEGGAKETWDRFAEILRELQPA